MDYDPTLDVAIDDPADAELTPNSGGYPCAAARCQWHSGDGATCSIFPAAQGPQLDESATCMSFEPSGEEALPPEEEMPPDMLGMDMGMGMSAPAAPMPAPSLPPLPPRR